MTGRSAIGRVWTEIGTGDNSQGLPGFLDRIDPVTNRVNGSMRMAVIAASFTRLNGHGEDG